MSLHYVSTRGKAPELAFADVLLEGLATDGGLYVPRTWPELPAPSPFPSPPVAEAGDAGGRRRIDFARRSADGHRQPRRTHRRRQWSTRGQREPTEGGDAGG